MMTLRDCIDYFQLSPPQVANFLWMDLVFSYPDEECHSLCELSAEHLKALGEYLIERGLEKEAGENPPISEGIFGYDLI
jgi:hypothetical protein